MAERAESSSSGDSRVGYPEATSTAPSNGARLAATTERLAGILRAQVDGADPGSGSTPDSAVSPDQPAGWRGTGEGDEPAPPLRPDGRVGVEEILERLADELETEFARTYGSAGG